MCVNLSSMFHNKECECVYVMYISLMIYILLMFNISLMFVFVRMEGGGIRWLALMLTFPQAVG